MAASSDQPGRPDPVHDCAHALDELKAAFDAGFDNITAAFDELRRTWDTGLAATLRQLDETQERTDELARLVSDNLPLLQRIAARRR